MKAQDIIEMARSVKKNWKINDPYEIATRLGISVIHTNSCVKDFTAHTIKMPGYPTTISINNKYSEKAKKILCAHELGHALLHEQCINYFATTSSNVMTNIEFEANLFAVALLADNDINMKLSIPLEKMNNYLLKTIMDYNISTN